MTQTVICHHKRMTTQKRKKRFFLQACSCPRHGFYGNQVGSWLRLRPEWPTQKSLNRKQIKLQWRLWEKFKLDFYFFGWNGLASPRPGTWPYLPARCWLSLHQTSSRCEPRCYREQTHIRQDSVCVFKPSDLLIQDIKEDDLFADFVHVYTVKRK